MQMLTISFYFPGNEKVVDLLIKRGIDIKLKNDDGDTALHIAALNSNPKIAEMLIKAGADVNAAGKDISN